MNPKRYDIYFADLYPAIGSEIIKIRPVVIVSQDSMNQNLETVVICPITSSLHPTWRSRIQINCAGEQAEIAVDKIRMISKKRLIKRVDCLDEEKIQELKQTIFEMYAEGV